MGDYRKFALDDVPNSRAPARIKKELDEFVDATEFGFNVYVADPGTVIPWGYHRHPNHEEMFFVLSGELLIETPEEDYRVGRDEGFYVPRNHKNRARVAGDNPARFVAVGAPKASDDTIIEEECLHCGEVTGREFEVVTESGEDWQVLYCDACGKEIRRFT